MAGCNRTRAVEELLERTDTQPPSFTIHLHQEHWVLNNGSKFLYHNPTACILDDIRAHRIPVDFLDLFDAAKVPFYDGCMVVELLDYRPQRNKEPTPEKPERTRVVLHPNSETLWADICNMNQKYGGKWTDPDTLEIEAKILLTTAPPLCLDPDPNLTRIANHILRVTTPTVPNSLKRKAVVLEPEEDENEKTRRAKIMAFGGTTRPKLHTPSYRLLEIMQQSNRSKPQAATPPAQMPGHQYLNQPQPTASVAATPAPPQPKAASPTVASVADKKAPTPQQTKTVTPQAPYATTAYTHPNGTSTPAPAPNQFVNQHPHLNSAAPNNAPSPMQPQVYVSVQAATEAANRAATPVQQLPPAKARPPPQQSVQPPPQSYPHLQPQTQASPHSRPVQNLPPTATHQQSIPQSLPQSQVPLPPGPQHHIQQPQRPPSRPQSSRLSQTPIPIQPHQQQLQSQAVPSPVQHHSPAPASSNQPQPQPQQPLPHSQASPPPHLQQAHQTPQISHQTTAPGPVQATTPQYAQSPKPHVQTAPTPQPQPQPALQHAQPIAGFQNPRPPHMLQQQGGVARLKAPTAQNAAGEQQPNAPGLQPGQPTTPAQQQQLRMLYQHHIQQQQYANAKAKRGATPAANQMAPQNLPIAARGSPMVANQQLANQQLANQQLANQQLAAAAAAGARGFPGNMHHAQFLRHYQLQAAAMRGQNGGPALSADQMKQQQAHAQAQAQAQAQVQAQAQAHAQAQQGQQGQSKPAQVPQQAHTAAAAALSQQYYLQMGYNLQGMGYTWPGMGRGMGMMNGQAQVQAQAGQQAQQQAQQQQQMAIAMGKPGVPGQMPNR